MEEKKNYKVMYDEMVTKNINILFFIFNSFVFYPKCIDYTHDRSIEIYKI